MKVDRVLANHSLSSTAYQGTTNIPFPSLSLFPWPQPFGRENEGKGKKNPESIRLSPASQQGTLFHTVAGSE